MQFTTTIPVFPTEIRYGACLNIKDINKTNFTFQIFKTMMVADGLSFIAVYLNLI